MSASLRPSNASPATNLRAMRCVLVNHAGYDRFLTAQKARSRLPGRSARNSFDARLFSGH